VIEAVHERCGIPKAAENAHGACLPRPQDRGGERGGLDSSGRQVPCRLCRSKPENLFDIRSLLRDDAFRKALDQCTADDKALKEYIDAIEMFEDSIPTPQEIASLLGVPVAKIYDCRRKLARRLGKHGFTTSRRRSKV
jgi:hypothetical protein